MRDGYIKVAAITPEVKVGDPSYNAGQICEKITEVSAKKAVVAVFPELSMTGATCGDLFYQELLLQQAKQELFRIAEHTREKNILVFVGLPLSYEGCLYNVAAAISGGRVLGFVPKTAISNSMNQSRYFTSALEENVLVEVKENMVVPMGKRLLFTPDVMKELKIAVEIGEDAWLPNAPGISHSLSGANLLVHLWAKEKVSDEECYRKEMMQGQSSRLFCGYVSAGAGGGESTQDFVCAGENLILEAGKILDSSEDFSAHILYGDLDIQKLQIQRRRTKNFICSENQYEKITYRMEKIETPFHKRISPSPFLPKEQKLRDMWCQKILSTQTMALKKRLEHTGCKCAVLGISGGLDSTLALLVTVQAFDALGLDRKEIYGVTMPGFGTTGRTYENALEMIKNLGATLQEISIKEAVLLHFRDIGHSKDLQDITYENSQARERTQILMDLANRYAGMVIGTGDMSELALGWATYNGDHMSMYGVNAGVPKTMVRHLVDYYARNCAKNQLSDILLDVLDTPVSPELLPPKEGEISQKTEDLVGPYELHDFYLYYMLRYGFAPRKIYRLAQNAFEGVYDKDTIHKWMEIFYRRFFTQQFKRSCLPDGPKVTGISLSPRGNFCMPSDATMKIWQEEIAKL